MSKADNLLDTLSETEITTYSMDPSKEEHIVIDQDRFINVPASLRRIAVQDDHNAETVTFDCPRYWDGTDMLKMEKFIDYTRPDGSSDRYEITDAVEDENDPSVMHFTWTFDDYATEFNGNLTFLIYIRQLDVITLLEIFKWHTELNSQFTISKGLDVESEVIERQPSLVNQMIAAVIKVEDTVAEVDKTLGGIGTTLEEVNSAITDATGALADLEGAKEAITKSAIDAATDAATDNVKASLNGFTVDENGDGRFSGDVYANTSASDEKVNDNKLATMKDLADAAPKGFSINDNKEALFEGNIYIGGEISPGNKVVTPTTNYFLTQQTAETGTDLDECKTAGLYYFSGDASKYTYYNLPTGVRNGWLEVFTQNNYVKQIFHRHGSVKPDNCHQTFVRNYCVYDTGAEVKEWQWSSWKQFATVDDIGDVDTSGFVTTEEFNAYKAQANYKPIAITNFSISPDKVHVGTQETFTFTVACSKEIAEATIGDDSMTVDVSDKTKATLTTDITHTTDTTYTATATEVLDENVVTKAATDDEWCKVKVEHEIGYGVYGDDITDYDTFFENLSSKVWQTVNNIDFDISYSADQYVYVCMPSKLGECTFYSGTDVMKLPASFELVETEDIKTYKITNSDGIKDNYRIYKSSSTGNGVSVHIYVT